MSALPLGIVLSVPAFIAMDHIRSAAIVYAATGAISVAGTLVSVPAVVMITESLPKSVRAGTLGTLYACAIAVFGGSTQFVVRWLVDATGSALAPAWYLTIALIIGGVAITTMREPSSHGISVEK